MRMISKESPSVGNDCIKIVIDVVWPRTNNFVSSDDENVNYNFWKIIDFVATKIK